MTATLQDGALKFHSFHLLRQIFDLSAYYNEATDVDIQEFANSEIVAVQDADALVSISDTWVRMKLWLISQSQILQKIPVSDIKAVAAEFNINLSTTNDGGEEKIVIPDTKKDLKTLLRFLDEDYYKSPLLQNHYMTNSKRPL